MTTTQALEGIAAAAVEDERDILVRFRSESKYFKTERIRISSFDGRRVGVGNTLVRAWAAYLKASK